LRIVSFGDSAFEKACGIIAPVGRRLNTKDFGTTLPHWGWDAPLIKEWMSSIHCATVWVFMILIAILAIHMAAAFKHLLVNRDEVFAWMLPSSREESARQAARIPNCRREET
jgi:cytochrome b561